MTIEISEEPILTCDCDDCVEWRATWQTEPIAHMVSVEPKD